MMTRGDEENTVGLLWVQNTDKNRVRLQVLCERVCRRARYDAGGMNMMDLPAVSTFSCIV